MSVDPFQPPTSRLLDPVWLNKFGDDRAELYAISVSPAENWGRKGPHLLFRLHRDDDRCPDVSAAVKRSEVVELYAAIGAWLSATEANGASA